MQINKSSFSTKNTLKFAKLNTQSQHREAVVREQNLPAHSCTGVSWYSGAILAGLISLTVYLSGDLNERSGIVHLPTILWLIFAIGLTVAPILLKRSTPKLIFTRLDIGIYLFFFYVFLSTIWALFHDAEPRSTLNMLSVWILGATAWYVFRQLIHDTKMTAAILAIITAIAFTESGLALHQQFVEIPKIKKLVKEDPINSVKQAAPNIDPTTPAWDMVYSRLITALPVGTYALSNTLGGFLGCWLILILGTYTLAKPRNENCTNIDNNQITTFNYGREILFGLFALMLLTAFVLAKSRSGFVAVGVGFVMLMFFLIRQRMGKPAKRFLFIVTIILIAGAAAVNMTAGKDLINGAKKSFGFRLEYWSASLAMIQDYPVLGCGTGNFKHTYTHYKLPISSEEISDPHNFIFEIASNSGIPSVLIFVLAVSMICVRIRNNTTDDLHTSSNSAIAPDSKFCLKESSVAVSDLSNKKIRTDLHEQHERLKQKKRHSTDWLLPYLVGGLIGCYVVFFISLYSESPLGIDSLFVSTLVFILFGFIGISRFERIPSVVILVAVIVLFVHISASSGISMTNTVILIWLLLSILANRKTSSKYTDISASELQPKLRYMISVIFIFIVLFVNFFGFRPVVISNGILRELDLVGGVDGIGRVDEQVLFVADAAKADPYSAIIQEQLARTAMVCYLREPKESKWFAMVEDAQAKAMRLAPRSGMIRYSCAEMRAEAGRRLKDVKLAESSIAIYREALKYYPNNAAIHTAFAIILYQLDMKTEAGTQAKIAINLDDQMPQPELKIKPEKREALLKYIETQNDTTTH
ncbi:MAG: O-antigen ligase family protein [Planctomycetaceae bacterium]|jgi:O-antigen ligase|nr:O-antigen ligase family protein [Planctomycetaceae bacterium]